MKPSSATYISKQAGRLRSRIARLRIGRSIDLLIKPALPILASLTCSSIIGLSDAYLAGRIGTEGLAAMAFCEQFWFLLSLTTSALGSGITVGLAAKNSTKAQYFLVTSLLASAITGVALLLASLLLAQVLRVHPAWLNSESVEIAGYFQVCAYSMLPFTILQSQCAAFRAANRNGCVLRVWLIAAALEICVANLFVFLGWKSLAALAASWGIACFTAMVDGFRLLSPGLRQFDLSAYKNASWKEHFCDAKFIAEIGFPIALSELGLVASSFINLHMISLLPEAKTLEAAWAIKTRLEEFASFAPACAVAFAVTPFVARYSHSRWAGKQRWATTILLTAITISTIAPIVVCAILQTTSGALVHIFTTEAAVHEKTCLVLSLSSLAWPFFTLTQLFFSALAGKGKTFLPSILTLICILPVRFGLALVLRDYPRLEGITAITISGVIAQAILAICMISYFFATMKKRTKSANRMPALVGSVSAQAMPELP